MVTIVLIAFAVLAVGGLILGVVLSGNRKVAPGLAEGAPAPAGNPRGDVRTAGSADD